MKIKLVIPLVMAFLAFIFIVQNTDTVRVDFLAWSVEMSVVLLLLIMLATGMVIGWALGGYLRYLKTRGAPGGPAKTKDSRGQTKDAIDREGGR